MERPTGRKKSPNVGKNTTLNAVASVVSTLFKIYQLYGFSGKFASDKTIAHWMKLTEASGGNWMKVAKYKLAAFYTAAHGLQNPKAPEGFGEDRPDTLLGGAAGRWCRTFLFQKSSQVESFLQSVKQAKKGCQRPDAQMVKNSVAATVEKLTGTVEEEKKKGVWLLDWADVEEDLPDEVDLILSEQTVKKQIERTVREIFKGQTYTVSDRIKPFYPSTSANYINSRARGGALGTILDTYPELLHGLRRFGGQMSVGIDETTDEKSGKERVSRPLGTLLSDEVKKEETEDEPEEEGNLLPKVEADTRGLEESFKTLWLRLLAKAKDEPLDVEPVGLAEGLKVRVITKGPPLRQTVLRPLWKKMHSVLRKLKTFQLIGTPVTEEIILNVLGQKLEDDEVYLSGDYEAATDNIKSWASNHAAAVVGNELNLYRVEQRMFTESLTQHIFAGHKPQTQGQLMGSITSFPILCILNATGSRWAVEMAERRKYSLKDTKMLINGDDVAIRSRRTVYEHWKKISAFIGLKESLGKTYVSREFVDINSTSFVRTKEPFEIECTGREGAKIMRMTSLRLTKYVNFGLVNGLKRSQGTIGLNDQDDPRNNLGARARELIRLSPLELQHSAMRLFVKTHKKLLDTMRLPWYIPEWLGGVGLPSGSWGGPSVLDLRIAQRILYSWKKERPISLAHQEVSWQTWKLAEESLPKPGFTREKGEGTDLFTELMGKKCVDLLFDSSIDMTDLLQEPQKGTGMRVANAIKKNAKLWAPKQKGGSNKLPQPIEIEKLQFLTLYPAYLSGGQRTEQLTLNKSVATKKDVDLTAHTDVGTENSGK